MTPKKEFIFILSLSFLMPVILYALFVFYTPASFTKDANTRIQIQDIPSVFKKEEPTSILFVGDIMLDRTIRKDGENYGYSNLFSCLQDEFSKYDEVVGNLEGTITNFQSVSRDAAYEAPESFRFTFDTEAVQALTNIGLSTVSIANNHIRDFGEKGIEQTISNAKSLNVSIFGDPRLTEQTYLLKEINGTKVAFIPYNQFFGTKEQTLNALIETQNISDIQIVFAHWGDEYTPVKSEIKILAHDFVDLGADLIIGAHPHVIQENEIYVGVPIYYSLGNFIFDQYWVESVRTGLGVSVEIKNKKISNTQNIFFESKRHAGTCKKTLTQ